MSELEGSDVRIQYAASGALGVGDAPVQSSDDASS